MSEIKILRIRQIDYLNAGNLHSSLKSPQATPHFLTSWQLDEAVRRDASRRFRCELLAYKILLVQMFVQCQLYAETIRL